MEVHAHTHTPRKKWSHYFWEFLMLFLAVFCGFLAEYKLEHTIEHQRAKAYATNLYEELKNDTIRLNYLIKEANRVSKKLDTLCLYSSEKKERNITNGMLYYYASFTVNVDYFSSNNATVEELKGSGNLRLMKSKVAHEISEYDKKIRELENEYETSKGEFEKFEALYFKIYDGYIMESITSGKSEIKNRDSVFKLNIPLINDDPKLMKEFIGWMKFEQTIYEMQSERYLAPLKQDAIELLALLKKEYHLE
jgi:hypothetical protein